MTGECEFKKECDGMFPGRCRVQQIQDCRYRKFVIQIVEKVKEELENKRQKAVIDLCGVESADWNEFISELLDRGLSAFAICQMFKGIRLSNSIFVKIIGYDHATDEVVVDSNTEEEVKVKEV